LDSSHKACVNAAAEAAAAAAGTTVVSIPLQQLSFSVSPTCVVVTISCCFLLPNLTNSVCCRMPASGTMAAPFGRVMSGRGFAPGSFQPHDIPAAGQFTKDLPNIGSKPNIDVWLQQAKMANSMQLFGKDFLNNSMRPVARGELRLPELQVCAVLFDRHCTAHLAVVKCHPFMDLAALCAFAAYRLQVCQHTGQA